MYLSPTFGFCRFWSGFYANNLLRRQRQCHPARGGTLVTIAVASFFTGSIVAQLAFAGTEIVSVLQRCSYVNASAAGMLRETDASLITCIVPEAPIVVQRFQVGYLVVSTDTSDTSLGFSLPVAAGEFVLYAEPEVHSFFPIVAPSFTAGTTLTVSGMSSDSAFAVCTGFGHKTNAFSTSMFSCRHRVVRCNE